MPTGYTQTLMEKGQTFQEFAMLCARAFGACIMMRDDPMDAKIPEEFKPSDYHEKAMRAAEHQLDRLTSMKAEDKLNFGEKQKRQEIKTWLGSIAKNKVENERLESMRQQVVLWHPPTKDHEEFKEFMLQQIDVSKYDDSYAQSALRDAEARNAMGYWKLALESAKCDIEYHAKELKAEKDRCASRTAWIHNLRKSLIGPERKAA